MDFSLLELLFLTHVIPEKLEIKSPKISWHSVNGHTVTKNGNQRGQNEGLKVKSENI